MELRAHWDGIYRSKGHRHVSWYRPHLDTSLALIHETQIGRDAAIIDVGAGASTLVDDLIRQGYSNLTALDVSAEAIAILRERLAADAGRVNCLVGNVLDVALDRRFVLWHDRAVFHFLTTSGDRRRYVEQLRAALAPGGFAIIATFGPDGPARCSGLPTARYRAAEITALLGEEFHLVVEREERHVTPASVKQQFIYGLWARSEAMSNS